MEKSTHSFLRIFLAIFLILSLLAALAVIIYRGPAAISSDFVFADNLFNAIIVTIAGIWSFFLIKKSVVMLKTKEIEPATYLRVLLLQIGLIIFSWLFMLAA